MKIRYHGITHGIPSWLLPLWRKLLCPKNIHAFDEVDSFGGQHYLSCDACGLRVIIHSIDTTDQSL